MRLALRDYQTEALERIAAAETRGVRRQLLVAATGLGKTVVFCALAERRGGRTLILAHRDELIEQAAAKVVEVWPEARPGIVKAGRNEVDAHVVVASVQTLARAKRLDQLVDACRLFGTFDLVVVDEAHHAAAPTYRAIIDGLRAGDPGADVCPTCGNTGTVERLATPDEVDDGCELGIAYDACPADGWHVRYPAPAGPLLLGVTATPQRGDGKGLDDVFDEIVASYPLLWGIRAGYLADVRGIRVRVEGLDLASVKVNRGDYDQGEAGRRMEDADAPDMIVRAWAEHAPHRQTVVFTPTVEVARRVAEAFGAWGVSAGFVHGGTPMDERRATLAAFARGDLRVVANCAVLTEGYDEPTISCIVVARPTKSHGLYTQMVGRGTRRHPDKTDLLVLDVVGATDDLSLVTVPSLFGLGEKHHAGMGDGSMLLTSAVAAWEQEQITLGRLRAEEVELFKHVRGGGIAWVPLHHRDGLRRFVRPMPKVGDVEQPTVVLAQRVPGENVWTAGIQMPDQTKRVLIANVTLETAQGVGEDYVRKTVGDRQVLVATDARWRARRPTAKAVAAAGKWHLPNVGQYKTAGDLSDALEAHIARIKSRPRKAKKETT